MKNPMKSFPFSEDNPEMLDFQNRIKKAQLVKNVLLNEIGVAPNRSQWYGLDLGCSGGIITKYISPYFKLLVGTDIDRKAIYFAIKNSARKNLRYLIADAQSIPFRSGLFDVVICNHIYQYIDNLPKLFNEIYRILKPGSYCYLAVVNRYCLREPQYLLPFLSWFPDRIASLYLKISGRGTHYQNRFLSHRALLKLLNKFEVRDVTIDTLKNPERYQCFTGWLKKLAKFPYWFLKSGLMFSPAFILLLHKKSLL